ncbi:hypothetical protein PPYR_14626 [Photinus pyralis]|uniref:Uncharacterized protein n=4 Tax=Photinus pyralis TaxID=7054 RepID=A0A5N4A5S9_PHOPY|nr:uncharacterized protein LOC116180265 [Photinus pyralis]KAB0792667.1 hypothetical protein PPYR_14626 [Photinus pyralis]
MSYGSLPPVPGLIPISALRKSPSCNNDLRECTPCAIKKEVMGEQRPRRTGSQPSVDLIDIARRSRGYVDTPQAPPSGKARAARHRKSDRRRERRGGRKRSSSKRREIVEEEKCVNPRVNPIFVWIRQEDTHIVDVKCEDYDKRNRIVLTKTAQGWRAIPRTETLVPNLKAAAAPAAVEEEDSFKQQTRKGRKSNRVKRKSTAVQVDDDDAIDEQEMNESEEPTWNVPVNIESHLPSHTIKVQRKRSPSPEQITTEADDSNENVNTSVEHNYIAQVPSAECSAKKVCDVTPLDNLLAVAELEFNQQIQTEAWRESEGMQQDLELLSKEGISVHGDQFESECEREEEDCDYNEEDENNLAMDDILNRLEQSLQSPDTLCTDLAESIMREGEEEKTPHTQVPENTLAETVEQVCSTVTDDRPTDLSTTKKVECLTIPSSDEDLLPTDLSVPKKKPRSPSPRPVSPRPSSRCSETIQSPQPSGLPAVPHSPDVQAGTKTAYLESLLSSSSHKGPLNSDMRRLTEPLDFGKCRKSASPTVTCSEEINTCTSSTSRDGEPEPKKGRLDDITLRTILDAATLQNRDDPKRNSKNESSRLLELLTTEMEPDALTQLKQLHADPNINLPDPMLVPKDRLSLILMSPGKEIPKLLNQRPELRLPEALAFPHLLQDPDILVITISQLEMIIKKQTTINAPEKAKPSPTAPCKKPPDLPFKPAEREKPPAAKQQPKPPPPPKDVPPRVPDVCNDPNMMWLPYLHQLEVAAMAFGNGDFLKMISSFPPYSNQMSDVSQMFPLNRFPHPTFPLPPLPNNVSSSNPFEFPIWHESANYQQQQRQLCANGKPPYRDYADKTKGHKFPAAKSQFAPAATMYQHAAPLPHQYMNLPSAYQPPPPRPNIQIPQYNAILTQKNPLYAKDKATLYPKSAPKYPAQKHQVGGSQKFKTPNDAVKRGEFVTQQPMDLSGSTAKAKPVSLGKSLKFDDVPEVGSTTASIEDMTSHMQESQKHLWHPLFGNQKSSANPWNWTTVTATGE